MKKGFTLAEMMVVMLILTILLAAFAPFMTKRKSVDLSSPWRFASNNSDIYYGLASEQSAMIGQNSKSSTDPSNRLTLNTDNTNQNHILFKNKNTILGALKATTDSLFLGSRDNYTNLTGQNNTAFGIGAMHSMTTGIGNVAVGHNSLASETTSRHNVAIGDEALSGSITAGGNIAIGYQAGNKLTNYSNVAIGYQSMNETASDGGNIGIGELALASSSGSGNIGIGEEALAGIQGSGNIGIIANFAHNSSESNIGNIAIGSGDGYTAPLSDGNGRYNIALGVGALSKGTVGHEDNIAIGRNTMYEQFGWEEVGGSGNIAIGAQAIERMGGGNNNIAIGYKAGTGTSEYNGYISENNIAIGAYSSLWRVGSNKTCIGYQACDRLSGYNGNTENIVFVPNKLVAGGIIQAVEVVQTSDKRLKNIKGENKYGLDKIREMKVYDFTWKKDKKSGNRIGVMAQDMQKIIPDAVTKSPDGFLYLNKDFITYTLVNAVKELDSFVQGIINELKIVLQKISKIEVRINSLENENKKLKIENQKLKNQIIEINKKLESIEERI